MNQPIDYISIKRDVIDVLPRMPSEAIKVLLVLLAREQAQKTLKLGMTLPELMRTADLGKTACMRGIEYLKEPDLDPPFIFVKPKGVNFTINLNTYWTGEEGTPIPFTFKDTDSTRIETVEKELRRVELRQKKKTESGLVEILNGEERDVIREIEKAQGVALDTLDGYFLGKAIRAYGPERVRTTFRQMSRQKNPIRATIAVLTKGAKGQGAKQVESEPFQRVTYKNLDD